jgi:hypothetical protein
MYVYNASQFKAMYVPYICVYATLFSRRGCLQIFTCSMLLTGKWEYAFQFIVLAKEEGNEEQLWKG